MANRTPSSSARDRGRRPAAEAAAPAPPVDREMRLLRVAVAVCLLATLLLSHRLWLSSRGYPAVPLLAGLPQLPAPLDWMVLIAMLGALAGVAAAPRPRPFLWTALSIGAGWGILDQTRWQPYMLTYAAALLCLLVHELSAVRRHRSPAGAWAAAPLQLAIGATYVYSGLHKFNHHYVTRDFYWLTGPLGRMLAERAGTAGTALALGSAALETLLGAGLLFPRTRRAAVVGLTAMHLFILGALGPAGYGVNSVVWPWNAFMVSAVWLLFWRAAPAARFDAFVRAWWARLRGRRVDGAPPPAPLAACWTAVAVVFGVLPALSFAGAWDANLSFQLYAGKQPIVWIYFAPDQRDALPAALGELEEVPGQVLLSKWALRELNVAPVTEPRVLRGLGRALARRAPAAEVKVVVAGPPSATGGARRFWFYTFPGPEHAPVRTDVPVPAGWVEPGG